ncbi:hypothetical protein IKF02_00225 [Candidatus Saccharibacteria bacterium]|nr:hypothetical protein [Candidatus Saccharibacteria bacterium]
MNQNPTVDNDLQKAIDDITNNTNTDPVFSDPVAAPSSVPEGDTGALAEPVGPFPEPLPPAPVEPIAPIVPDLNIPEMPTPAPEAVVTDTVSETIAMPQTNLDIHQVKEAALRDLIPLLDRLSMSPSQKFNLYRDIFDNLRDYTVLGPAYNAAKEITDDTERGEALLYLVESIDKM